MIDGYDYAIIGSGIYGMYAAKLIAEAGQKVVILECEDRPFQRASYINQARVHFGYHYPRSYSTAVKSCGYFERFCEEFGFAINRSFKKIYAISSRYSLTSASQFQKFCHQAKIPCEEVGPDKYFNDNAVEAAFETREYAFDAQRISNHLERLLKDTLNVEFRFNSFIECAEKSDKSYKLRLNNGSILKAHNVLNSTYASINQVNKLFDQDMFEEAIEAYDRAIQINPDSVDALVSKGAALKNLGRYKESGKACDQALRINPKSAGAWANKAAALGSLGKFKESLTACDQSLKYDPNFFNALIIKSSVLPFLGKFSEAIEVYDKVLIIDPNDADIWNNKGAILDELGQYDDAMKAYDQALKIDPNHIKARENR